MRVLKTVIGFGLSVVGSIILWGVCNVLFPEWILWTFGAVVVAVVIIVAGGYLFDGE